MRTRPMLAVVTTVFLVAACGEPADPGAQPDPAPPDEAPDDPADEDAPDPHADFDRDAATADAEALLGLPEDELEETPDRRIVRRGDEEFMVTMDLQPGRENLELDDDGTGTYVVTRVTVEAPDDDHIVVE